MATTDLYTTTHRLLKSHAHRTDSSLPEIAEDSGVGYEWLKKFAAGAIDNPGVKTVQHLHDYLQRRRS